MGHLLDLAIRFLNDGGWRFTQSDEDNWVSLNFTGESGSWVSWFQDRGSALVAYAVCPVKAPTDRLPAVAELISRANYGLGVGNLEMSFETGAIRYKNGIYARDEQLSTAMVEHLFYIANSTMDDYFPAIMAVLYGDTSPQAAVTRVEEAIERRRAAVSPVDDVADSVETAPELRNEELETLLATLSSGFGAAGEVEAQPVVENVTMEPLDDGTRIESQGNAQ